MRTMLAVAFVTLAVPFSSLQAQRLQDRIDAVRAQDQRRAQQREQAAQPPPLLIPQKMSSLIDEVTFDQTQASVAFNWWAARTGIPLVIDWNAMENDGVDPAQPITMELQTVPARLLLDALIRQASPDIQLIYEATPWYVQVMTKRQANRHPVMRVYDVADMVMHIPNFTNAPNFNLTSALSNTNSGGGGGGGGSAGGGSGGGGSSKLFSNSNNSGNEKEDLPSKTERGQGLADTIRNSIEPSIWQTNGGEFSSVRYYNGRLIVNAPLYVHRQIGIPVARVRQPGLQGGYLQD
jgi:general secretion pathway protein D